MNLMKMAENVKQLHSPEAKKRQIHLLLASLAALLKKGK